MITLGDGKSIAAAMLDTATISVKISCWKWWGGACANGQVISGKQHRCVISGKHRAHICVCGERLITVKAVRKR